MNLQTLGEKEFREQIYFLVYNAVFCEDKEKKEKKFKELLEKLKTFGYRPFSIYPLYKKFSEKFLGFTVPAVNLRGITFDLACTFFRVARRLNVGALIFEIAKSEMGYTRQSPLEYATVILSAAFKEDYKGPVFIQGDHFQLNRKAYFANSEREIENIKTLIKEAISSGFYNIDIDASTLVVLERKTVFEQQRENFEVTARLTEFIRQIEPKGITVNTGGEIGEIGGHNSTPEELRAFLDGFNQTFKGEIGISKISVQTGTSHGGVVLPDGRVAKVAVDFNTLKTLSRIAREEYGLAGAVQHGASTLPEEYFGLFPENECVEIHLATGFQNFIYDHPAFPEEFRQKIYSYLKEHLKQEWKEGMTEAQFIYKTRKKGFGLFKKEFWDLPDEVKEKIFSDMEGLIEKIFKALNIPGTLDLVNEVVR